MKVWRYLTCRCCKEKPVNIDPLYCEICMEEGTLRSCCGKVFCDYDYNKTKLCPNCNTPVKKEKRKTEGTIYLGQGFSEHEECRCCLELGLKRRCCGNYYCDTCYYEQKTCRSCGSLVGKKGLNSETKNKASLISVLLGWFASVFVLLVILAGIAVILASELQAPVGIYDNKCTEYFAQCDTYVCIDVDASVGNFPYNSLGSLYESKFCNLNSKVKLQAQACIFDSELYKSTDGSLGFDVCSDEYENGVYVFEDTFDNWQNQSNFKSNLMVSGNWSEQVNAYASNDCGSFSGRSALTFYGEFFRFMTTNDLDVKFGGFVEAQLFIASENVDINRFPKCKSSFQGDVVVQYSTDYGTTWNVLKQFPSTTYRQNSFFHIKLEIPKEGHTTHTRIRFIQPTFESARDTWALDDVKVYHYFEAGWRNRDSFRRAIAKSADQVQRAQCCFDTEHCETRLSTGQMKSCSDIPWFSTPQYQLRGLELIICFAMLANIIKFFYNSVEDWMIRGRIPFQEEYDYIIRLDKLMNLLPVEFRPNRRRDDTIEEIHRFARDAVKAEQEAGDSDVVDMVAHLIKLKEDKKKLESLKRKQSRKSKKLKKKNKEEESKEMVIVDIEEATVERKAIVPEPNDDMHLDLTSYSHGENSDFEPEDDAEAGQAKLRAMIGGPKKYTGLRVPIELENEPTFRMAFAVVILGMLVIFFLYKAGTQANYLVVEDVNAYGQIRSEINIYSGGILLFALFCDGKEIYHTLKKVVPLYGALIPHVTIDSSSDANALYVGSHTVSLGDVLEAHVFPQSFAWGCLAGYFFGCLPWALILMIIRDQYLAYDVMRIMTPALGSILIIRAILGPGIFLKVYFTIEYGIDFGIKSREAIGYSLQTDRTRRAAIHFAFAFALGGTFMVSIFAVEFTGIAFGCFLLIGFIYGVLTGCIHGLPVHPWFILTKMQEGVWLRLKKKERCPCIYWGRYCTDMHSVQDMFIVFPRDPVMFMSRLKGVVV